jgi:hypothetical protein
MTPAEDRPRHKLRVVIILTVVVGLIASAVAYFGTRRGPEAPLPPAAGLARDSTASVLTVVLPHEEVVLPAGPHQRTFVTSCTICHSPLLVMTQPPFPRKKWEEVINKMVKTYGAPISTEDQEQILNYLLTVRGQ